MIPLKEATAISRKMIPITQRIVTAILPFRCSEFGISGFLPYQITKKTATG
jgi:hypothetical protein